MWGIDVTFSDHDLCDEQVRQVDDWFTELASETFFVERWYGQGNRRYWRVIITERLGTATLALARARELAVRFRGDVGLDGEVVAVSVVLRSLQHAGIDSLPGMNRTVAYF